MKNELGIEICCANCIVKDSTILRQTCDCEYCRKNEYAFYHTKDETYRNRIRELKKQVFTKEEAKKIETFLIHGYQMMINENKKIFSKLEKMKGEQ
jgi:hypothetical protein